MNFFKKQLLRTRAKQEEDVIFPFISHDEVEARQAAVKNLAQLERNEMNDCIEYQMKKLHANLLKLNVTSPPSNLHCKLRRLPRYK